MNNAMKNTLFCLLSSFGAFVWLIAFAMLGVLGGFVNGQDKLPQIDSAEVLRLGDHVQHVDGYQSGDEDAFMQAMELPADDGDKWFVSVLTSPDCAYCVKLKNDWMASAEMMALADPSKPTKGWAFYGEYLSSDASQIARFESLKVAAFPTIVVQPPRSGKYGSPATVVYRHTGYLPPKQLAAEIRDSVKIYVQKIGANGPPVTPKPPQVMPLLPEEKRADVPTISAEQREKTQDDRPRELVNRLPPQPFDPTGETQREAVFPIFPRDQVPDIPPQGILRPGRGGLLGGWVPGQMFSSMSDFVWAIVGLILSLACGVVMLCLFLYTLPLWGKLGGWIVWLIPNAPVRQPETESAPVVREVEIVDSQPDFQAMIDAAVSKAMSKPTTTTRKPTVAKKTTMRSTTSRARR